VRYETAIKADDFLVMAHGSRVDVERARAVLGTMHPKQLEMHPIASAGSAAELASI